MKFFSTFIIAFSCFSLLAQQQYVGLQTDNFFASTYAPFNPSAIVDSKTKMSFNTSMNYLKMSNFFSQTYLVYLGFTDLATLGIAGKYIEHKRPGYYDLNLNFDILNAKYEINHDNAIGYSFRFRNSGSITGLPEIWTKNGVDNYEQNTINSPMSIEGLTMNQLAFTEHAFTYARVILDRKTEVLKVGGTIKILNGLRAKSIHFYEGQLSFTDSTSSNATLTGASAEFFSNEQDFQEFYKSRGFGLDLGVTYEIRPKYELQYYEMDGKSKNIRYDINKYKMKFAASITDIGSLKFRNGDEVSSFENANTTIKASEIYSNASIGLIDDNYIKANIQNTGTIPANLPADFRMNLPTSLHLNVDYYWKKNMYVNYNISLPISLPNDHTKVHNTYIQTITPRVETNKYAVMLPISHTGNGKFNLGLAARVNLVKLTVFAGSQNFAFFYGQKSSLTRSLFTGVSFNIPYKMPSDIDQDKVSDELDDCPDDHGLYEFQGCPDTDGDEIPDKIDFCIYNKGPKETNGCPDTDEDGIIDMNDLCPNVKGLGVHYGCPDKDFDGVIDMADKCPDVPGIELNNGCPLENPGCCMDNDGDGVSNNVDKCPDHAGSVYNDGCPIDSLNINKINLRDKKNQLDPNNTGEQIKVLKNNDTIRNFITSQEQMNKIMADKTILAEHNVYFNHDQATITQQELQNFDQFFAQLSLTDGVKLMVIGHTDKDGSLDYNLVLSKKRAETIKRKLMEYGYPEDKITLYYFGETKSQHKGSYSAEQKKMDRRVEIKIVQN